MGGLKKLKRFQIVTDSIVANHRGRLKVVRV
jgi:hypothetical protein